MNIEISNEQIEQLVKKAVNDRVRVWFKEDKNKYFIRDAVTRSVDKEVRKIVGETTIDIQKLASSVATNELAEKIADNIGCTIANIFAEEYGD